MVLARHLGIEPKTSSTKPEIRQLMLPVLITKNIVGEENDEKTEEKENTETSTMMLKTRNYDQEFELEKLKLQMEAKRQEREHIEKLEKMRIEKEERERERQERERERQERGKERQFELGKLKLQQSNHPIGQSFDVIKNFQAVPSFQEDDVDMFFLHFEKLAANLNWPKDHWTILLQKALFVGKAREIFAQLSVEQSQKYEYVKDVVLRGYQLNPEAYRQKFRNYQRDISQTFVEFARVKEQLFDHWCHSKKVNKDFESFGSSF